jgi:hypothetical protein
MRLNRCPVDAASASASVARERDPGGARAADAAGGLSFPDVPRLET